jgi:3-methyl-2-oxobutanoate hydroxymethyltransferase
MMPEDTEPGKNVPPKTRTRRGGLNRRRGQSPAIAAKPAPEKTAPAQAKESKPAPNKPVSKGSSRNANSRDRRGSAPRGRKTAASDKPKSLVDPERKATPNYLQKLKGKRPISALTAYDAPTAKLACASGVDFLLVGDSVGTTLLGFDTTLPVTLDMMTHHAAAARRGSPECLLVVDLPFAEASFSFDHLLTSCRRLMQEGGADAIKLEGGRKVSDGIERLVRAGIPVMGHVGLLPQTVKAISGYRKFGKEREEAEDILNDAVALEEAGCFAIVAEMVEERLAGELAKSLEVPIIGIGSGNGCDGQILVSADLLGLTLGQTPSFVKRQADLANEMTKAFRSYVEEVRSGRYPGK